MTTDTLPAARARRTADNGTEPAPRNAHQRKLAVMRRCDAISPDKTHPAHHFKYNSIQNVSDHLRRFLVEEGLDYTPSVDGGEMVVTFTNVDEPSDTIVSRWPIVDGDKGYAYSTKFPLIRIFLIGDGEENDEAEMAQRSGQQARPRATPPQQRDRPARKVAIDGRACPECGEQLYAIYKDNKGAFVGHEAFPSPCQWKADNDQRRTYLREAAADPDPPKGPHALPAGQQATFDYVGALKVIHDTDEAKAMSIFKDKRFARTEGEKVGDWLARLEQSQRAELRMVIEAALADVPIPA